MPLPPPDYRGKVRDIYDLGDRLLLVATDRISAFDVVFRETIPEKGKVLSSLSRWWFEEVPEVRSIVPNHLLSADPEAYPEPFRSHAAHLRGRSMLVRKCRRIDFECVVRGFLAGSAWKEYRVRGTVHGERLPPFLRESDRLPTPLFTPATKAESGHDENVPFRAMEEAVGRPLARRLRDISIALYEAGARRAERGGLLLADTKFEFGLDESGEVVLIDEVLTPDSSRFWSASDYAPGRPQDPFDKQFVRDYLETLEWDKQPPPPPLPPAVVEGTARRYREAYRRIVGRAWEDRADRASAPRRIEGVVA